MLKKIKIIYLSFTTAILMVPAGTLAAGAVNASNPIVKDIQSIFDFLSAGVGIVVIGSIIFGGIQYTMAGDNPTAVTAAKQRIINSLIALVAFIFMYAFIQWLVPGGIF